jgi:hypothetical protein
MNELAICLQNGIGYQTNTDPNISADLLHYTLGAPCFHEFATTNQADEWHREHMLADYCLQRGTK